MNEHIAYPHPPAGHNNPVPKFEVFINYEEYTWECIVTDACDDYNGTFSINRMTGKVHIDWYQIPLNDEFWEEVEFTLRTLISSHD